jgi:hypothetical protein
MTTFQTAIDSMPVHEAACSGRSVVRPSGHSLEEVGRWETQFPPIRMWT